jgi:hypothetical protein
MFDPMMFLPHSCNLHQDLDRRWRRCGYLISHGCRPSWKRDDALTWDAWRFRLGLDGDHDQADRQQLDHHFPAITEAYRLYTNPVPLKRWELEARLLANETNAVIAAKCGLSVEAVQVYADLFYNVRPVLAADTYVALEVVGGKAHFGIEPDDFEALLKHFGYSFGGYAVDDMLEYIREPPTVPVCLTRLDLPALKRLRTQLKLKLIILHLSTPTSAAPAATWQRLGQDYDAARRRPQDREENDADVLCSIKATLDVMEILSNGVLASSDAETITTSTIDPICETGVHLVDRDTFIDERNISRSVPA